VTQLVTKLVTQLVRTFYGLNVLQYCYIYTYIYALYIIVLSCSRI